MTDEAKRETLFERMSRLATQARRPNMELFSKIEDAIANVRYPKGVHKQVNMYHRGETVYIAHGGGYVRIVQRFGKETELMTAHPDIKVVDFDAINVVEERGVLKYKA